MLRASEVLQIVVIALLGMAVVMVHSAGMTVQATGATPGVSGTPGTPGAAEGVLVILRSRTSLYAGLAILAMVVAVRLNIRRALEVRGWANPLFPVVALSLVLLVLTFVPGLGRSINGASRWLYLGPRIWGLSFQPSELLKWVLVVAIAFWCSRRRMVMHRFGMGLVPPLLLTAVACGLIVVEDLGTAALIALVAGCLLIAGGARLWQLVLMAPLAAAVLVAAIWHNPYRVQRLTAFFDPWSDPRGSGYHPIQSMLAIAQGGIGGRGLGNGVQKFGYLPEDTTDFIFAIICEELGLAGAVLVISLYLVILWVGLGVVRRCRDTFSRLVGLGVLLVIGLQTLINLAVVTVVVPTKGIALPLLSHGGTGWILTAAAVGMLASLDRTTTEESGEGRLEGWKHGRVGG